MSAEVICLSSWMISFAARFACSVQSLVDAEKWVKASQGAEGAKGTGLE
jgi:hypothetical protein